MKSIALDFKNNMICFMTAGQQGTETNPDLKKLHLTVLFLNNSETRIHSHGILKMKPLQSIRTTNSMRAAS